MRWEARRTLLDPLADVQADALAAMASCAHRSANKAPKLHFQGAKRIVHDQPDRPQRMMPPNPILKLKSSPVHIATAHQSTPDSVEASESRNHHRGERVSRHLLEPATWPDSHFHEGTLRRVTYFTSEFLMACRMSCMLPVKVRPPTAACG